MGDIPSGSKLLPHPFPVLRAIMAVQTFVLEFHRDEFADGGAANQPVILQGAVGLSSGQLSQCYCQFQSNFLWLPEIGN